MQFNIRLKICRFRIARLILRLGVLAGILLGSALESPAQEATPPGFRAYKLEHAPAAEFGAQLRKVLANSPGKPEVLVDRQLNRVLVQGADEAHRLTTQLVKSLDRPVPGADDVENADNKRAPRAEGGRYKLSNLTARQFEDELRRVWGGRLAFTASRTGELATVQLPGPPETPAMMQIDRVRGEISLAGPQGIIGPWDKVVRTLDAPRKVPGEQTQLVPVRRADPTQVQQAVSMVRAAMRGLQDNTGATVQLKGNGKGKSGSDLVSMIFQPRLRPEDQPEEQLEDPLRPVQPPPPPIDAANDGGLIGPVQIEFIEGLDVIVIRGNKRDVEKVMKIIEDIEAESERTKPAIEVYQLRHVTSQTISELVIQLYDQVLSSREGRVSITPLVKPNALLLIGRRESVDAVLDLVERLDRPVSPTALFKVFQLKHIQAASAQVTLQNFFLTQGGLAARITVVAEPRSNAVIVQAGPRDMAEVAKLLARIDVEDSNYTFEMRVFKLKNALAQDLGPVLQNAINGRQQGTAGAGQGAVLPGQINPGLGQGGAQQQQVASTLTFLMLESGEGKLLKSGILSDVIVTADARNNSLLIRAPAKSMDLIAALIAQLDNLPAAEAQIKVFTIVNGDATNLNTMLQQLFGVSGQQQGGGNLQNFLQSATGSGESPLVALRFAVDQRTNSIIASGSSGDLNVVEAVLLRLDEGDIETRKTTVYRLRNAPAIDVAASINQLLTNQRTVQNLAQNVVSAFERMDREVIVVPEVVSNSLIVSATPKFFDEIRRVVEQLDARPPMVMIQVVIAEVTLSDRKELGIELGLQDSLLFTRGIGGAVPVGFPFNQANLGNDLGAASLATRELLAGQALSNLSVGRTNAALGYGGLVLSAGNESINILLRALHDQQRLQVLSRPQVMTLDNQPAFVQVGERVPRITSSQITVNGTINNTVLENVGILMGVTPRTSPDGLVVMEVDVEKSALGAEADGIPVSINAAGDVIRSPRINITTAQTTISAKSGQTVVFAGLITKTKTNVTRRTPYLSDIPVLGNLFRFDTDDDRRTELLIIMTPYVVRGEEDADWVKRMESDRMSWCLADVIEIHQEGKGLSGNAGPWGSEATPMIYPDLDPSGMEMVPTPAGPGPGMVPVQPELHPELRLRPDLLPSDRSGSSRRTQRAASAGSATALPGEERPPVPPSFGNGSRQPTPAVPAAADATTKVWLGPAPAPGKLYVPPAKGLSPDDSRGVAPVSFEELPTDARPIMSNYQTRPTRLPQVK